MNDIVARLHMMRDPLAAEAAKEIERLMDSQRRAMVIANERSKENVDLRAERKQLRAEIVRLRSALAAAEPSDTVAIDGQVKK